MLATSLTVLATQSFGGRPRPEDSSRWTRSGARSPTTTLATYWSGRPTCVGKGGLSDRTLPAHPSAPALTRRPHTHLRCRPGRAAPRSSGEPAPCEAGAQYAMPPRNAMQERSALPRPMIAVSSRPGVRLLSAGTQAVRESTGSETMPTGCNRLRPSGEFPLRGGHYRAQFVLPTSMLLPRRLYFTCPHYLQEGGREDAG